MGYLKAVKRSRRRRSEELFNVVFRATRGDEKTVKEFFDDQD